MISAPTAFPAVPIAIPIRLTSVSNFALISRQVETLVAILNDEIERRRGHNSLPDSEHVENQTLIGLLKALRQAAENLLTALDAGISGTSNALVVVRDNLPKIVEAAGDYVANGGDPNVSGAVVTIGATIEYLTKRGTPGSLATGIAVVDAIKGTVTKYLEERKKPKSD